MTNPNSRTTRLTEFIAKLYPWGRGHQIKAFVAFVEVLLEARSCTQAKIAATIYSSRALLNEVCQRLSVHLSVIRNQIYLATWQLGQIANACRLRIGGHQLLRLLRLALIRSAGQKFWSGSMKCGKALRDSEARDPLIVKICRLRSDELE